MTNIQARNLRQKTHFSLRYIMSQQLFCLNRKIAAIIPFHSWSYDSSLSSLETASGSQKTCTLWWKLPEGGNKKILWLKTIKIQEWHIFCCCYVSYPGSVLLHIGPVLVKLHYIQMFQLDEVIKHCFHFFLSNIKRNVDSFTRKPSYM